MKPSLPVPSNLKSAYSEYKSVYECKLTDVIKIEIKNIKKWAPTTDKYCTKNQLTSGYKIQALEEILEERGE